MLIGQFRTGAKQTKLLRLERGGPFHREPGGNEEGEVKGHSPVAVSSTEGDLEQEKQQSRLSPSIYQIIYSLPPPPPPELQLSTCNQRGGSRNRTFAGKNASKKQRRP